jgi:intracellular sulfur oxidation DsrE/DsrF family protein
MERDATMRKVFGVAALALGLSVATAPGAVAADAADALKEHHLAVQVDQDDPEVMNLVLNNAKNVIEYYREQHEDVQVEIVAYGPGLHMLRDDTSPVKDRIKQLKELSFPSSLTFSACNVTKEGMEKREGHPVPIIAQASLVPSGVVRLMERQEQGWSYVRP